MSRFNFPFLLLVVITGTAVTGLLSAWAHARSGEGDLGTLLLAVLSLLIVSMLSPLLFQIVARASRIRREIRGEAPIAGVHDEEAKR